MGPEKAAPRQFVSRYPTKKDWWLWGSVALLALTCLLANQSTVGNHNLKNNKYGIYL